MRLAPPSPTARRAWACAVALVAALAPPPRPAAAYEFTVEARSIGQGYQLRWFRFSEEALLNRRRFTQTLRLHIWDILRPGFDPAYPEKPRVAPADLYFVSAMRFQHDFGGWTQGSALSTPALGDLTALDAIPELARESMEIDLPYAYLGGRRIWGFLDFELGRQLVVDSLDWYSFDGLTLHARTPWRFTVEAHGGLRVRDSSFVGSPTHEPDGTSSLRCFFFDPAVNVWRSYETEARCGQLEQRDQLMPTFGAAIESEGLRRVQARLAYRRAQSPTAGGVYPDAAPGWGVNEEKLTLSARGNFWSGGIVPWGAARWNLLLAAIDEAHAGVRLAWSQQAVTPEIAYSLPSFDGDSIFNVFSIEPYYDYRVSYDLWPRRGRFRAHARAFLREFFAETDAVDDPTTPEVETTVLAPGESVDESVWAGGAAAGASLAWPGARARLDLFYEDGHGGLRAGGDASGWYRIARDLEVEARVTLIQFDEDSLANLHGVTFGAQGGGRWVLAEGIALHLLAEENINRFYTSQLRVIAVLDLAFHPEL